MESDIYKKEYSIWKILSESWKAFVQNFKIISIITIVVYVPFNIILAYVPIDTLNGPRAYMLTMVILDGLIGVIAIMAIAYTVKSRIDGRKISVGEALKGSLSKWGAAIDTNIVLSIFVAALTLLFIIPGIIYRVYWIFAIYVTAFYGEHGAEALYHSKKIVRGRWWKVAIYSFLFGLLGLIIGSILGFIDRSILELFPEGISLTSKVVLDTLLVDILLAYFTVVSVVFFINLDSTKREIISKSSIQEGVSLKDNR